MGLQPLLTQMWERLPAGGLSWFTSPERGAHSIPQDPQNPLSPGPGNSGEGSDFDTKSLP